MQRSPLLSRNERENRDAKREQRQYGRPDAEGEQPLVPAFGNLEQLDCILDLRSQFLDVRVVGRRGRLKLGDLLL
jgi:hypothetical protein